MKKAVATKFWIGAESHQVYRETRKIFEKVENVVFPKDDSQHKAQKETEKKKARILPAASRRLRMFGTRRTCCHGPLLLRQLPHLEFFDEQRYSR